MKYGKIVSIGRNAMAIKFIIQKLNYMHNNPYRQNGSFRSMLLNMYIALLNFIFVENKVFIQ